MYKFNFTLVSLEELVDFTYKSSSANITVQNAVFRQNKEIMTKQLIPYNLL